MSVMQVYLWHERAVRRTTGEIEEERRLLYVAMTRAKDDLHLIVPQRFFHAPAERARKQACLASRTRLVPHLFAVGTWPVASAQAAARVPGQRRFTRSAAQPFLMDAAKK